MAPKSIQTNMNSGSLFDDYEDLEDLDEEDMPMDDMPMDNEMMGAETPMEEAMPLMGMSEMHRRNLQQVDMYFNPLMDVPEIEEAERERFNPSSDPYAASMGFEDDGADGSYQNRRLFKDDMIATLQQKAQTRALATAKFQNMATKKQK